MPPEPAKFDVTAALAIGVPEGKLREQLCAGESVTLPSGRLVEPHEVLGASSAGERILIVDCPSIDHLRLLRAHPALQSGGAAAPAPAAAAPGGGEQGGAVGGEGGEGGEDGVTTSKAAEGEAAEEAGEVAGEEAGEQGGKRAESGDAAAATEGAAAAEGREKGAAVPPLHAVIHLTGAAVRETAEYTAWCASLPAATTQLFTGEAPQPQVTRTLTRTLPFTLAVTLAGEP